MNADIVSNSNLLSSGVKVKVRLGGANYENVSRISCDIVTGASHNRLLDTDTEALHASLQREEDLERRGALFRLRNLKCSPRQSRSESYIPIAEKIYDVDDIRMDRKIKMKVRTPAKR